MLEIFTPLLDLPPIKMTLDYVVLGYKIMAVTAFAWGPFVMWEMAVAMKKKLKGPEFVVKQSFKLLEISVPKNMDKSPLAMELVLNALHQADIWFSLEMVSREGKVRFYIYTPKDYVRHVTSHLYAQYPDLEVKEVEDYVPRMPFSKDPKKYELYGTEFKLSKADAFPIKTYKAYGLEKLDIKEEYKIDPLTTVIEHLGAVGRGQEMWVQIMIQATGKRFKKKGVVNIPWWKPWEKDWIKHRTGDIHKADWRDEAKEMIEKMKADATSAYKKEVFDAVEASLGKPGFDCGIRAIYVAEADKYDKTQVTPLKQMFKPFSSVDLNGFEPMKNKETNLSLAWSEVVDIPFMGRKKVEEQGLSDDISIWDAFSIKEKIAELLAKRKKKLYLAYLARAFFYAKGKPFVLNSEELATIFHFPGLASATPTFERIESRKAEPPSNLPI